jgi:hypothetical protein
LVQSGSRDPVVRLASLERRELKERQANKDRKALADRLAFRASRASVGTPERKGFWASLARGGTAARLARLACLVPLEPVAQRGALVLASLAHPVEVVSVGCLACRDQLAARVSQV